MVTIEFSKIIKTKHGEQKINAACAFSSEKNGEYDLSNIDQQIEKFIAQLHSQHISFVDIIENIKIIDGHSLIDPKLFVEQKKTLIKAEQKKLKKDEDVFSLNK